MILAVADGSTLSPGDRVFIDERYMTELVTEWGVFYGIREEFVVAKEEQG
jgi:hypothetical protein